MPQRARAKRYHSIAPPPSFVVFVLVGCVVPHRPDGEAARAGIALRAQPSGAALPARRRRRASMRTAYLLDRIQCASVPASALVNCVFAGIGTLPHTPTLPLTIVCAR
ncbi:hypothetical protein Y034_5992 [Burkholderia pseudomallei MSHR449]|nr:hypothetical protein Y034_5992 [Burkholderia pseudomallei MSHR449]